MTPDEEAALEELVEALEWHYDAPHTLEAIAERLGMSHQLVHQIEVRALKKLKRLLVRKGITDCAREPMQLQSSGHPGAEVPVPGNGQTPKRLFE